MKGVEKLFNFATSGWAFNIGGVVVTAMGTSFKHGLSLVKGFVLVCWR